MSQGVHADVLQTCFGGRLLDALQQVARVERPAELTPEHQTGIGPLIAGVQPLRELRGVVRLSIATTAGDSGTVRRDRGGFGSVMTSSPPTRDRVAATFSDPSLRSPCSQANASASARRRPVAAMNTSTGPGGERPRRPSGRRRPARSARTVGRHTGAHARVEENLRSPPVTLISDQLAALDKAADAVSGNRFEDLSWVSAGRE